ncbi:3-deoxy-D-manno-octulosonic acid transferase [Photobacterium swingsii]|uniref:3-deoxy-D-manno-octulosonic acid transferase n=1 Tax=Photobacterium swingsii TaxID=680026 RepID=UPI0040679DA8
MKPNHFLAKHFTLLYRFGFVLGIVLAIIYAHHQILRGDQTQMLFKGYLGAYSDLWLNYGNFASTVGNLPGSLSAWLVGWPLMVWDSPWAPMLLIIALRVVSFFLFDSIIKQVFSSTTRLLFMLLYWLSPWLLYDTLMYNPAYLCLFASMHFWSAFQMRHKPSFIYSFIHVISIGMAMQLHFSWPILAVMSSYLFYRGVIKVSWAGIISAMIVIIASLVPYLTELMTNDALVEESDRYIGWGGVHVYPVLKAFLYWVRYGSFLFSNRIITDATFDWLTTVGWLQTVVQYLWQAVLFVVGGLTVVVSAKINWRCWKLIRPQILRDSKKVDDMTWLLLFAFAAIFGIFISAILSPIIFSYWHLIIAYPFGLIPILYLAEQWQPSNQQKFLQYFMIAAGFLLVVNLVAAHDSNKFSYKVDYAQQVEQYVEQNKAQLIK